MLAHIVVCVRKYNISSVCVYVCVQQYWRMCCRTYNFDQINSTRLRRNQRSSVSDHLNVSVAPGWALSAVALGTAVDRGGMITMAPGVMKYWLDTKQFTLDMLSRDNLHMTNASYQCRARLMADTVTQAGRPRDGQAIRLLSGPNAVRNAASPK